MFKRSAWIGFCVLVMLLGMTFGADIEYTTKEAVIGEKKAIEISINSDNLLTADKSDISIKKTVYAGDVEIKLYEKYAYNVSVTDKSYKCKCKEIIEVNNETKSELPVTYCETCYTYKNKEKEGIQEVKEGFELSGIKKVYEVAKPIRIEAMGEGWGYSVWSDVTLFGSKIEGATWWNESWDYRQEINVSNTAGNLTNYQVRKELNLSNFNYTHANITGKDIRFTNSSDELIDYWIELWNISGSSYIWVEVPFLENATNTTINMYYGNSNVETTSSGDDTFILFDDFLGDALDTDKWDGFGTVNVSGGYLETSFNTNNNRVSSKNNYLGEYAIRYRFMVTGNMGRIGFQENPSVALNTVDSGDHIGVQVGVTEIYTNFRNTTAFQNLDGVSDIINWHIFEMLWLSGSAQIKYDEADLRTTTNADYVPDEAMYIKAASGYSKVDWVLLRNYASPEPIYTFGAEELKEIPTNFTQSKSLDIEENSTGEITITFNITDENGLYKCYFAKTLYNSINDTYYWSVRYPPNNKSESSDVYPDLGSIFRADNRNEGRDFEDYSDLTESNYFKWAILENESERLLITGNITDWQMNFTSNIFDTAFQNSWIIDRTQMQEKGYKMQEIKKVNPIMIEGISLLEFENRSNSMFIYLNYTGIPVGSLQVWYCNSSYESGVKYSLSENCGFTGAYSYTDIDYSYSIRNSSYMRVPMGIFGDKLAGIDTTYNFSIVLVRSVAATAQGRYYIGYANETTDTDIGFSQTETMYVSANSGVDWTDTQKSPNVWFSTAQEGLIFQYKAYCIDSLTNEYSSEIYNDSIGLSHFAPSASIVYALDGNESWDRAITNGNITISILTGTSNWDSNLTYNISLYSLGGDPVNSINDSFYGENVNLTYDTTANDDGYYRFYTCSIDSDGKYACLLSAYYFEIRNRIFIANPNKRLILFPIREIIYP